MTYTLFPPLILDNQISLQDLNDLKSEIHNNNICSPYVHNWEGENFGKIFSNRYMGDWNNVNLKNLVLKNLPQDISKVMIVENIIHLQSFIPYEFHCDYGWSKCNDDEKPFVVIIIPLESVNARTIICEQTMEGLHFVDYKKDHEPLPKDKQISEKEYLEYFSHCWPQERPYVKIKDIFEWKAGSVLIFDQKYIHASDNFLKHGLTEKNCISIFSKIKKESFHELCNKDKNLAFVQWKGQESSKL